MTDEQIIHVLEVNRDANLNRPKFVEACDTAITAIRENRPLKTDALYYREEQCVCGAE